MKSGKTKKYTSRWIVFIIDTFFSFASVLGAWVVTALLFGVHFYPLFNFSIAGTFIVVVRIGGFFVMRTYSGIIRYTTAQDAKRIFVMLSVGELLLLAGNAAFYLAGSASLVPYTFLAAEYFLLSAAMITSRFVFKYAYGKYINSERLLRRVVIYGDGEYVQMVMTVLAGAVDVRYRIVAVVSGESSLAGNKIGGINVYKFSKLDFVLSRNAPIHSVIIACKVIPADMKSQIIHTAMRHGVKVGEITDFDSLLNGTAGAGQIHNIRIEDLLNRGAIELDETAIGSEIAGKTVLVTGAAGSIGSELVRQLSRFNPGRIVLVDMAESPLYDIELEARENTLFEDAVVEMCNVRDIRRMDLIFSRYRPQVVYHAAAYKHVPMIENLPYEGIRTNIFGTKTVADLALQFGCEKFVMISTDKAVNPTNVMGCTKRIAEIYTQTLNKLGRTRFITTRFGNVLGSNGSVIPRFARQIEEGGPVTVTHPEITRFL